jgi:hypothetical protein
MSSRVNSSVSRGGSGPGAGASGAITPTGTNSSSGPPAFDQFSAGANTRLHVDDSLHDSDISVDSTHGLINKTSCSSSSEHVVSPVPAEDIEHGAATTEEDETEQRYTEQRRDRRNSTTANFLFAPQGIEYASEFPVLLSTHLVFFKINDYIDFDRTRPDHFFFIFYSMESFCDFALAFFILITEVMVMANVFLELRQSCLSDYQPSGIWMVR